MSVAPSGRQYRAGSGGRGLLVLGGCEAFVPRESRLSEARSSGSSTSMIFSVSAGNLTIGGG
jgi:hypothetical protein